MRMAVWRASPRPTEADAGSIQVTVIDADKNPLATGKPITGNVTDAEVSFGKEDALAHLLGRPVRLKFEIEQAKLYSFSVGEQPTSRCQYTLTALGLKRHTVA